MKRLVCMVALLCLTLPCWSAARKITVTQLQDTLQSLQNAKKSDAEVADTLKQLELTEELTRPVMNSLAGSLPGQLSTEQIYVLEARSAMLAPPAADLPATAAPDAATQQALLAKTASYTGATYDKLPHLSVQRTTLRFQDNMEALAQSSGQTGSAKDATMGTGFVPPNHYVRYIGSTDTTIGMDQGVERLPADKTKWGANRMVALMEPYPSLTQVFREASDAGTLKWVRWETVNGKPAAVFSYQVPRKKAHLAINVCCFPELDQAGIMHLASASPGAAGQRSSEGNFQTNTDWKAYKKNDLPYHGELFIDPDSGTVVRMITQMEPKSSDVVHQDDIRTDYAPVALAGESLVLPVRAIAITRVVVNGEAGAGGYAERCTLLTSEYKDSVPAGK